MRKELSFWGAIALSLGIMAPTLAMSLNGIGPAGLVGASVPLAFLMTFAAVGLVAYSFVRLTQRFNHAGSVYALAGASIGPRAGFFSGFGLLGVYLAFALGTVAATGLFGESFLGSLLDRADSPVGWLPLSVLTAVLVLLLATRDVKWVARALLSLEGLAVGLIVVLLLVVTVKVAGGDAPGNQSFNWEPFTVGDAGLAAVVGSTVFGFLSWAGFEGAAALGEETRDPRRNIPRAIIFSVVLLGIFYTLTMYIQIIGFGTDAEGVAAFIDSGVTLPALADAYVGRSMATLLLAGAVVSAFASALGCTAAAARILFALARDGFGPAALSRQSASTGTPNAAAGAIVTVTVVLLALVYLTPGGDQAINQYYWPATIGSLILLVVYGMTAVGALKHLWLSGPAKAPVWEAVIPVVSIGYLAYVFWKNVLPDVPYSWFPYAAAGWLLIGLAVVVLAPGLAARIGTALARDEGFRPTEATEPAVARHGRG
jgi:amino acid transporter